MSRREGEGREERKIDEEERQQVEINFRGNGNAIETIKQELKLN